MGRTTMCSDATGGFILEQIAKRTHAHSQIQNHGKHRKQKVSQINRQLTTVVDTVSIQHKQGEGGQGEGGLTI